jgi:undecaprenyl-diphosphatase
MNYDIIIFQSLNNLAGHNRWLDGVGIFLASYLPYILVVILLAVLWHFKKDRFNNLVMITVALGAGLIARFIIKPLILIFYLRPRPFMVLPSDHRLVSGLASENFQSFPSGHTILFFALSTAIFFYNKKLGWFFLISSALIGLARIFVGVHWPSDIFFGAIFGVLAAYLAKYIYSKQQVAIDSFLHNTFRRWI